jgi:hypothetical protein
MGLGDLFPIQVLATLLLVCFLGGIFFIWKLLIFLFNPRAYLSYDYRGNNGINDDIVLLVPPNRRQEEQRPSQFHIPPTSSLNGATKGGLFSPSLQQPKEQHLGSPPPGSSLLGGSSGLINQVDSMDPSVVYDSGNRRYQSPGLITPSKNGEWAHTRRSPYR